MAKSKVGISQLADAVMQGLQEYANLADTEMKKAVRKTATAVKKEIQSNAPKDSGDYAKSWATKKVSESSGKLQIAVYSKSPHYRLAHLLEKGHVKRDGDRVAARPHIAPAEKHGAELLEELIQKTIKG